MTYLLHIELVIATVLLSAAVLLASGSGSDVTPVSGGCGTEAAELQKQSWNRLTTHLGEWFHAPDLQALEVILSVALTHYWLADDPVWLFVVGPPGSGKTVITIEALRGLPKAYMVSDLTDRVLLSGFQKAKPEYSLLLRLGSSILMLFKDFTSFLAKRRDVQSEIMGNLREIWDGRFSKEFGSVSHKVEWKGKATIIAACTPALERAWSVQRDMGERFMMVRWRTGNDIEIARAANRQIGHEAEIKEQIRQLSCEFVKGAVPAEPLADFAQQGLVYLAKIVAETRRSVDRRENGEIIAVGEPEAPTRIAKAMSQVARAHAGLLGRKQVEECDLRIARRLGMDTIPGARRRIIDHVEESGATSYADLKDLTGMPMSTITWIVDELDALSVVERHKTEDGGMRWVRFTDQFAELRKQAGLTGPGGQA